MTLITDDQSSVIHLSLTLTFVYDMFIFYHMRHKVGMECLKHEMKFKKKGVSSLLILPKKLNFVVWVLIGNVLNKMLPISLQASS